MKKISILALAIVLMACHKNQDQITSVNDYDNYLNSEKVKTTSKFFELWNNKIKPDSLQLLSFGNVASEYNRYFKGTGNIKFLKKAENALEKAVEIANINKEGYLRALARNYIAQHRFKEALEQAKKARELKGGLKDTQGLLFDIHMELGNYDKAENYLDSIHNPSEFGYLIRVAKWNDYKGDLDTTIRFMEKALQKAESSKNKSLLLWSYSNIADYYGHAGRIKDSYEHYLKTLALNPNSAYAKKGIAWIVYSHEKNGKEAMRILNAITKNYQSPDYYLLKAEIAEFMNDTNKTVKNLDEYRASAMDLNYGNMYNAYNVDFTLAHTKETKSALRLALKELENRPTPESYNLLASTYLIMGETERALKIVQEHIEGKTFEPAILLSVAEIYKANKQFDQVQRLKHELEDSLYELGPVIGKKIALL